MKFNQESHSAVTVRHIEEGAIRIGDDTITNDVLLFREQVASWTAADRDNVTEKDLEELIDAGPEIIIFGTGWTPRLPPRELVFALARKGIGFECMDTPAACRTFNILVSEDRDVAAALLIS